MNDFSESLPRGVLFLAIAALVSALSVLSFTLGIVGG